jgi:hypothetical protein
MIRQMVAIYVKLFKVVIFLIAAAGMTIGGVEVERKLAKRALGYGLVQIPAIRN